MHSKNQFCNLLFRTISRAAAAALAIATVLALMVVQPPVITSRCGTDH